MSNLLLKFESNQFNSWTLILFRFIYKKETFLFWLVQNEYQDCPFGIFPFLHLRIRDSVYEKYDSKKDARRNASSQ